MNFAFFLESALDQAGCSQVDFADMLKVDPSSVSKWISGDRRPQIDSINSICKMIAIIQGRKQKKVLIQAFRAIIADLLIGHRWRLHVD